MYVETVNAISTDCTETCKKTKLKNDFLSVKTTTVSESTDGRMWHFFAQTMELGPLCYLCRSNKCEISIDFAMSGWARICADFCWSNPPAPRWFSWWLRRPNWRKFGGSNPGKSKFMWHLPPRKARARESAKPDGSGRAAGSLNPMRNKYLGMNRGEARWTLETTQPPRKLGSGTHGEKFKTKNWIIICVYSLCRDCCGGC